MRKFFQGVLTAAVVVSFVSVSFAGMIKGKLTKIDEKKSVYVVKEGKTKHEIHFDATTQKEGDVKVGSMVEVDEDNGHAKSVKVVEKKKAEKKEMKEEKKDDKKEAAPKK
ncbi:MAG: hypothetical protein PH343_06645 [Nitrospira sp.]|nr:hypothetical protein [Nitrospira sp.]